MKKNIKTLFKGLVSLVLCTQSLSATTQMTSEEMYQKGEEYEKAENYKEAVKLFCRAAEQEYAEAQLSLPLFAFRCLITIMNFDFQPLCLSNLRIRDRNWQCV